MRILSIRELQVFLFLESLAMVASFVSRWPLRARNTRVHSHRHESNDGEDIFLHHMALRTRNITLATDFYCSLFGFEVSYRFRAGPARAAWLSLPSLSNNNNNNNVAASLEIIEVPSFILEEPPGMRRRAPDLMENAQELGFNHMALDVTQQIRDDESLENLQAWMDRLNHKSLKRFGRNLRVALPPRQQLIGRNVYELAFIYDADGSLVEFLHKQGQVSQTVESGWDPWDGEAFKGFDGGGDQS